MSRAVIAQLRDFVPIRPLSREEALRITELQALRFREIIGHDTELLPESLIASLPRLQVERISPLPVSGATQWSAGRWLILLNGNEPATRQRFSLAHELKHILDHRFIDDLYQGVPEAERAAWVEQVCDYFAGCLLMPRPALKRAWVADQNIASLARRFGVSQAAMQVRLSQTGLAAPQPRCSQRSLSWAVDLINQTNRPRYHRAASLVTI